MSRAACVLLSLGALAGACKSFEDLHIEREPSFALAERSGTVLHDWTDGLEREHPGLSGFWPLERGIDAFLSRGALADAAQRTLDLQYYIVRGDEAGQLLLGRAYAAAERGVRVRVLIDDWTIVGADESLARLDAHPSIEVRIFNPRVGRSSFAPRRWFEILRDFRRLNRRMHNKLWLADNTLAIVGGRNLAEAYFETGATDSFQDLDLLACGPVVRELSTSFDAYWNDPFSVPIATFRKLAYGPAVSAELREHFAQQARDAEDGPFVQRVRGAPLAEAFRTRSVPWIWAAADTFVDDPAKLRLPVNAPELGQGASSLRLSAQLGERAPKATQEVLIVAPYFVPGRSGVDALRGLVERGVRVRVLTNSLASNNVLAAQAGYARYRADLLRAGVELHELRPAPAAEVSEEDWDFPGSSRAALHEKSFVIDRSSVFVGSLNMDPRSVRLNSEVGVLVHSTELAGRIVALFERSVSPQRSYRVFLHEGKLVWETELDGELRRFHTEPEAGPWRQMLQCLYGLVAPEGLL